MIHKKGFINSRLNIKDRVSIINHPFLSDGYVKHISFSVFGDIYIIKLDNKAPNEYAYETDEVVMYREDLELIS